MNNTIESYSNENGCIYHGDALEILKQIPNEVCGFDFCGSTI